MPNEIVRLDQVRQPSIQARIVLRRLDGDPDVQSLLPPLQGLVSSWKEQYYGIYTNRSLTEGSRYDITMHFLAHIALHHFRGLARTIFRNETGCFISGESNEFQVREQEAATLEKLAARIRREEVGGAMPTLLVRRYRNMKRKFGKPDISYGLDFEWSSQGMPANPRRVKVPIDMRS